MANFFSARLAPRAPHTSGAELLLRYVTLRYVTLRYVTLRYGPPRRELRPRPLCPPGVKANVPVGPGSSPGRRPRTELPGASWAARRRLLQQG